MDLSKILQESIINISPQVFLNRIVLFNLISDNEYETLQNSIELEQQLKNNKDFSTLTIFIVQKLNGKDAVFHERFKIFLGHYNDLISIYRNWESIGKSLTRNQDQFFVHYISCSQFQSTFID